MTTRTDVLTDASLEARIQTLKATIKEWIDRQDISPDWGFKSWAEHYADEPPELPCVLVIWFENELTWDLELESELIDVVSDTGFDYERQSTTIALIYVDCEALPLVDAYRDYYEWLWILQLLQEDYAALHEEVHERFVRSPEDLKRLSSRQFEEYLDAIFRNNGYRTELGPGSGDGGVDLRLYSSDVIGEALTLVQAKRYAAHRPIKLEAVQALSAAVEDERASRGVLVTTSRFLPSASAFAARQNKRLELATAKEVQAWSALSANRIIRDKSQFVERSQVRDLLQQSDRTDVVGGVFHARTGVGCIDNEFCIVLATTRTHALVLKLPKLVESPDGQVGTHLPDLSDSVLRAIGSHTVFRAKLKRDGDDVSLWGSGELWTRWNAKPISFDLLD